MQIKHIKQSNFEINSVTVWFEQLSDMTEFL
jgi:hypothetical protein